MINYIWGVPSTTTPRIKKEEKYVDTPVLTVLPTPEKGGGYKFELNKKALEVLGLELTGKEAVSISLSPKVDGEETTYTALLAVTTGKEVAQYLVKKNSSFSNKAIHQYLVNSLKLDGSLENEFELTESNEVEGMKIFSMNLIKED